MAPTLQDRPRLYARRPVEEKDITCPAGGICHGVDMRSNGVVCGIEDSLVSLTEQPRSLVAYCLGDYRTCPTWLAEKEREAAGGRTPLVDQ